MYRVKYYSDEFHPDHFKGKGLRGRWIVFLNWLRWRLEISIHRHVCLFLGTNPAIPESKVRAMFEQLNLDIQQDELNAARSAPSLQGVVDEPVPPPQPRATRYQIPTVQRQLEDVVAEETGLPRRPKPLNNLIGKYAFDQRAKRYANGREFTVQNSDGDFEPLENEDAQTTPDAR